jgi:L-ascorbate metabolism protein UlaG (beta-lactamase superfamily)
MSTIELTTWGHSGVRLERGGERLAIDPGLFTQAQVLDGVSAVLVTHEHADHVEPDKLAPLVAAQTDLNVWAPAPVVDALVASGAPAERVHAATPGEQFTAAGFDVRVLGGTHAVVHPTLPAVANVAYLIDGAVLHPGDSLTPAPEGVQVQVLALPISAPWLKIAEAVDYAVQVAPATAIPIHDAILSEAGRTLIDRLTDALTGSVAYRRLAPGESMGVAVD